MDSFCKQWLYSVCLVIAILVAKPTPLAQAQAVAQPTQATYIAYYGKGFYEELARGSRDNQLKGLLHILLTSYHVLVPNQFDEIVVGGSCEGKVGCYHHRVLGYDNARRILLGQFNLVQTPAGFGIREVYCGRIYNQAEFGSSEPPGPQLIPNGSVVNTEHTWPQSLFNRRYPSEEQKSDLHHLFPTDSRANSIRGNHDFGQVVNSTEKMPCSASKAGPAINGKGLVFEPPDNHKGNVARALFYFSTRYDLPINQQEEAYLKLWNKLDPVDLEEAQRNQAIFQVEGTRNPFIDFPDLADRIADF